MQRFEPNLKNPAQEYRRQVVYEATLKLRNIYLNPINGMHPHSNIGLSRSQQRKPLKNEYNSYGPFQNFGNVQPPKRKITTVYFLEPPDQNIQKLSAHNEVSNRIHETPIKLPNIQAQQKKERKGTAIPSMHKRIMRAKTPKIQSFFETSPWTGLFLDRTSVV